MAKISTSSRCIDETTATLSLEVKNYLQLKGLNAGDYVSSRVSTVGDYDWEIRFYPQGIKDDCAGNASVLGPAKKDVGANFTFSMLENKSQAEVARFDARNRVFRSPKYDRWGYPKFVDKSKLESLSHLGDGCFTILCILTVGHEPPLELPGDFERILRDETGTDITFGVAGHEFRAHRSLLAARSSIFHEQFFGPKAEKDRLLRVEVVNMEPAIFKMMLHYIYTDALPECEYEGGYGAATMQDLLAASTSYKLDRLKLICEEELCKKIDTETITTLSAFADQHSCKRLKDACDEFVSSPK